MDWSTLPTANNCRRKAWHRLSSHSPGQLKMAAAFVRYNSQSSEHFVMRNCSAGKIKLYTRQSSLRPASAISEYFSDEVQEFPAVLALNDLARALAR